jgi:antitoxin component of MazEF toxin-antitoxin module
MSEPKRMERYEGTVVQIGNSRGMRLPAGFFQAHPEFTGKVELTVVADGEVLVSAKAPARRRSKADGSEAADPLMTSFLRFLETQMTRHPEDIVAADADQLRRIGKLVKGVGSA